MKSAKYFNILHLIVYKKHTKIKKNKGEYLYACRNNKI